MNFKFLFNDNLVDNRLMQRVISSVPGIPMSPASSISTLNEEEEEQQNNQAQVTTPEPKSIMFNGKDTGYIYDNNLSARKNRKLLKQTLKAKGLGDKADATGLISEYLTSQGGAKGKDAAWLARKAHQYEYTTDGSGNVDYHRKVTPFDNFAEVVGGSLLGPVGAALGWGLTNNWGQKSKNNNAISGFRTPQPNVVNNNVVAKEATPVATEPVNTTPVATESTQTTQPINYTFTGFSGPWGSHIQNVYNDNQSSEHWGKMDIDKDGQITQDEFSTYQGQLGQTADGKLGRNTLAALGLSSQQNNYNWMNPINPNSSYTPTQSDMWVDNTKSFGFNGAVNGAQGTGGYVNRTEWEKARTNWYNDWESRVSDEQKSQWNQKFGKDNYTVKFDPNINSYVTSVINKQNVPGNINQRYNHNTRTMAWYNGNQPIQGIINAQGKRIQFNEYGIANNGRGQYKIDDNGQILYRTQLGSWRAADEGTAVFRNGGLLKFQHGGQLDDQDKMLLASTLGLIGYAASQGKQIQIEEAVAQVASLAQSQPQSLQELASNKELVNAGIQAVGQETVQKLSQPGVMKQLLSKLVNKMPKAMKGTKLNYIKELKGICPEGYELQYFAAGGHLCSRCAAKKKIEEAKCGKKMKAKKHSEGGISDTMNEIKNEVSDSNQKPLKNKQTTPVNDGRKKNNLPTSPKTYDSKKHKQLINDFKKNSYSYKGWPVAKKDSLMKYNELLSSDEDGDWHF